MTYILTIAIVLSVMAAWLAVQAAANHFARRHPEFGPARKMGVGCCGKCDDNTCEKSSAAEGH